MKIKNSRPLRNLTTRKISLLSVFLLMFSSLLTFAQPANDNPCGAIPLTPAAACTYANYTNVGATNTAAVAAPTCAFYSTGTDVWFTVTVPAGGSFTVDMNTGTMTDSGLGIYTNTGGCAGTFTQVGCDDDSSPNGLMSMLNAAGLTPGTTVYIRVWGYGGSTGTFGICVTLPPPPPANDNPCSATPIPVNSASGCVYTNSTNVGATVSPGVPAPTCGTGPFADVWFTCTVPASGNLALATNAGGLTDASMAVYSGTCGALSLIGCNDNGATLMPGLTLSGLTPGSTVWINVWDNFNDQTGTFGICATDPPPPGPGDNCGQAIPFCTGTTYTFPNNTAQPSLGSGGPYGCLGSTPNPVWYFMQIANPGNIDITINQTSSSTGLGIDVDFVCWGPFTSQAAACAGYGAGNIVDCSYSAAATETVNIVGATTGQFYLLLMTNFSNQAGTISFTNTGGTGTTNCAILCNMTALTATPSACAPATNTYSVSGTITVTAPPSGAGAGTLTVTSSCGGSMVINPPFGTSIPYTLSGLTPTGGACSITATFSADPTCTLTTPYTSPAPCSTCSLTAGNSGPVCTGSTFNLTATSAGAGATYSWTSSTGFTSTAQNPTGVTAPATSGTYTYTVTATVGAATCSSVTTLTVNPRPTMTAPANVSVCAGTAVAATAFASVPAGATYAWTNSNTAIGLGASGTGNVPGFTTTNTTGAPISGTITVTPTLGACPGTPVTYTITVNPQPTSTFTQSPNQCLSSNSFNFTNTGSSGAGYTYSWNFGGGGATPATSTVNSPTGVVYSTPGTYTVTHTITAPGGCTSTTTSTVTIFPQPVVTVNDPTICAGQTATLTAGGASSYSWSTGSTSNPLTISPAATTSYTVTGTSVNGCTGTDVATVTVTPLPVVTVNSPTICAGASATLTAAGATTYLWSTGSTSNPITPSPAGTTTYTVTGTTGACSNTAVSTVTVNPLPTVVAETNITICAGATVAANTFASTPAGATFTWTNSNTAIGLAASGTTSTPSFTATNATASPITATITITPTLSGCNGPTSTYTITVNPLPTVTVNSVTVCPGGTASLTATGASTYTWSAGVTVTGVGTATASPASTTSYTVTGTSVAGCTATAVSTVTVASALAITVNSPTICNGSAATLTAGGGTTYTWSAGATSTGVNTATASPATTTSYTVTGTTAGCSNTAVSTVTVNPLPTVTPETNITICAGATVAANTFASTPAGATFTWTNSNTAIGLAASGTTSTPSFTATNATASPITATITITPTLSGCVGPASTYTITVNPLPVTTVNSPTICPGGTATLTAGGATTYAWTAGVTVTGVNTATATPGTTTSYTVTGTSSGCTSTAVATVTVASSLTVTVNSPTICNGQVATLTASGASTYTWSAGASSTGVNTASASPSATTSYTVTGTSAGCTNTAVATVTVNAIPVTTVNSPTICAGATATLTAGGATTYTWSAGATSTGVNTATATPASTTTYTVTGTTAGCSSTAISTVTVNPLPVVSVNSPTICAGATASLTASGASTYTWSAGAVSTGVATANATPASTTSYTVTGTLAGCTGTAVSTVTVTPLPVTTVNSPTICAGATANLTAGGATTYTWSAGASSTGVNTATAAPAATTTYTVTGTTSGCTSTAVANVTVNPLPIVTVNSPTICAGTSATLTAAGATTYSWSTGAATTSISVSPATTTSYTVTGTTAGCTGSAISTVTVTPLPIVAVNSPTICAGATANLTASGAATYTWSAGAVSTGTSTANASPAATTSYTVTGTLSGCTGTAVATVTVTPLPVTTVNSPTICAGATANLTAGGATTYTWSGGASSTGVNTATAVPATTTTYTVTGTTSGCTSTAVATVTVNPLPVVSVNSPTICAGAAATLTAAGAASYSWSTGAGTNPISVSPATTTSYTVTGTTAGCTGSAVSSVTVNPLPVVTVTSSTVCPGQTATMTASGATSYTWSAGATPSGPNTATASPGGTTSYTVTGTTSGCTATAVGTVTIGGSITVTVNSPTICPGGTATLTATGGTTYSWSTGASTNPITVSPAATTSYTVTGTMGGCTGSAVSTVTVNPALTVAVNSPTICNGQTATLTASGATTYAWSAGATSTGVTTADATPATTTSYTVTGTTAGCTGTAVSTVTVTPLPNVTVSSPTICAGTSATLTAGGATTYTWSAGATSTGVTTATASPASTSTYTVTGSASGCTNTAISTVTVTPLPIVSVNSPTICAGTTATLTASGATTYTWSAGATSTGVTTATATPATTTSYTVTGTATGCSSTAVATVTVNPLPVVTVNSPTICNGQTANLTASGATSYAWSAGASSTGVNTADATPAATTSYTVTGTTGSCSNTAVATVSVTPLPNVTVTSPTICTGATATLTAGGATTYTWSSGATSTGVTTATASPATTTSYTVTGTASGCSNTAVSTVTVTPLPVVSVNSPTICAGGTATLTASGATSYTWSAGATSTGVTTATASPAATTSYTVTGTATGCSSTAIATVTVNPLPLVTVNSPTICNGQTANLTASGATTYTWSVGASPTGVNTANATPSSTTSYTVTGTTAGCSNTVVATVTVTPLPTVTVTSPTVCFGATATMTAGGATTYTWSAGATPAGATTATAAPASTTTYTVTGTASGCSNTAVSTVTVTPLPIVSVNSVSICPGSTATLTASGASTYAWSAGAVPTGVNTASATPSSTTTYTVTGTVLGCSSTATATVTINSALTVNAGPDDTICFGQSTPLLVTPNGGGYSYSWSPSAGLSSTTIFNPSANPTTTTTYVVVVTDVNGCTGNDNVTIYSDPQIVPVVSGTNITCNAACNGSTTVATTGGSNSYTYLWTGGATTATSSSLCPGTYSVTVTDSWGCTASGSTSITQPSLLTASITASTPVTCSGACNGTATAAGAGGTPGYTYTWNTVPAQTSATATALCAGSYTVTVRDANNCTATTTVTITQPTVLAASITAQTNVTCFGASTGSVTVAGSGGTPTYQYSINAGSTYQASGTFSGLSAGSYTILVKDGNGCTVAQPVTITQPTAVTSSITAQTNVSCFGGNTGSVTFAGAGGTPTYQYSLNGGALQSSGTFTPLTAATYTVTVLDGNGCTVTQTVTITQPTQVTVTATKVDATCGAANGSINATGANGTGPYTYSIGGPFQASGSFTGLSAATYTVTVKDANGCTGTTTITVVDLSGLTASITAQTNVSCFGGNNGSVTVTASGSTGPYLYALNAGALGGSGTFSSLAQGTYTVTVQDGNGCSVTVPVTITQPTAVSGSLTAQTNISCNGLSNGSVTAAGAGGVTPYTYSLDGGPFVAGATFSGLTVGAHTITVKDANGCTVNIPVTITQPTALSLVTSVSNATCTAANGSATVTPSGGTPIYTYLWSPGGATTATDNSNTAGNYTVTVTDANGCTSTAMATIGSNPGATAVISSSVNVSCTGSNDGSATVSMGAGATPPFTYSWTPTSQTTVTATGLGPASYTVTVTDANGCISTASTLITEPTILAQTFTTTNVSCFGGSDGVITINPTGGTPGYTYLWTPGSYTTQTIAGLTAGTYTCVFTDANGCQKTAAVAITQPAGMNLTTSQVNATCSMSNGSATVSVTGGTGPYTYSWSSTPVQTTATATGLPANTYVVTVTDNNGCTQSAPVTIGNNAGPVATLFSQTNVSCFGQNDGAATVTISGGTIPFTFLWSNGQTLPTATNLVAGTYTLTATDASGCIASTSVTITQPLLLDLAMAITNPSCAGSCDGQLNSNTLGGTPPFSYLWNPGGVTTPFNLNLCAGTYTLQVTDANGCTAFKPAALTDPTAVTVSTVSFNVSCSGLCNGSATANPLTGTGPFTYLWSDISAQTTQTATGLCAGTYTVTITDAGGCTGTATAVITSPASMTASITSIGNNTCFNACDGYATAAVSGGTAPFAFNWMPISTAGASVNNLCAGTYTVTVIDANGCTASTTANITQPTALIASITSTNVTCFNACDATANAVYTGGTGPYTFQWTPTFQTTPSIINICDGVHNLTVTDVNGCTANASVVITQPTILAVTTTTTPSSCGNADGTACAAVTGGVPPFTYLWNDPSSQTNSCATNINAGNYIISITDGNGCSVTGVANVSDITAPVVTIPTSTNVTCAGAANGNAQANITGGVLPYNILWTPTGQTTAFISSLSGGIYSIAVTDSIGCVGTASVTINEPAPFVSGILTSAPVSCFLSCNGSATVGAGGGTTPYTYLWNDAATQTTATATGLCAAGYTVTITDANGCTTTSTTTITTPTAVSIALVSATNVSCNGGNNGTIAVSASGGIPGYTYTWTPAVGSGPSVTGLSAGTYTLVVTDQNGCSATAIYTISQPAMISLATITNPSTCGNSNGSVSVSPSGGTPGFTYLWNDPSAQTTAIASSLPQGNYTVIVTDNNGCTTSTVVVLNDIAGPTIGGFTFTEPLCNGTPLGMATVLPAGGTPLYTYLWSGVGAQTTQTATALTAGVYTVTVTDNNGCSATGSVNVTEPSPTQIIVSPTDTICVGENAIIYGAGYGGTPSYTYTWTPSTFTGAGPHVVNPTVTATYDVFLVDANGCVSPTQTITLFVNPPLSVTSTDVSVCSGSFVTISAVAGGGNGGPYTYTWSNSVTGSSQSVSPPIGLSPFDYIVTVDDGCSLLASDTSTVTVNPLPISFMLANDTAGCEDFTALFNGVSDIGTSYSWNFGDGTPDQTGEPVSHTFTNSGNYTITLTVTSALGCSSTVTNTNYITVNPSPTAAFSYSPTTVTQTAPLVSFTDLSSGVINSWMWDFDSPSGVFTDTLQNPSFSYNDTGSYVVQLVVMNNFGCADTAYNTVDVLPEYTLYAPNAFTPFNHDGLNDVFMPQGVGINPDDFEMTIYDRWGNMIYKTDDIHKGWDGHANGGRNLAQIDVYVWKVNTTDYKGDAHQYIGTVTIVK